MGLPHLLSPWRVAGEWWSSPGSWRWRACGAALRVPALLIMAAFLLERLLNLALLPASHFLVGEIDYREASWQAARGNDHVALTTIRAALLETRENADFWRLAGQISTRLDSPEATYCWQQVDRLRPGDFTTQMTIADLALHYRQLDGAAAALGEVAPAGQTSERFLGAAAQLASDWGETAQAADLFTRLEAWRPRDAAALLTLAGWQVSRGDPLSLKKGRSELQPLLRQSAVKPAALRLLIQLEIKAGDRTAAQRWSDQLLKTGAASMEDRVARLGILTGTDFAKQERGLEQAKDPAEIATVCAWLTAHGQATEALAWIQRQPAGAQAGVRLGVARAQALSALGDWRALRVAQNDVDWPGREHTRLMFLARARLEDGAEVDARATWNRAVLACQEYANYLELLDFLEGLPTANPIQVQFVQDARVAVWSRLTTRYVRQDWAWRALLGDALARGDSARTQNSWEQLAVINPTDVTAAANGARIALLRGDRPERASALLEKLARQHPENAAVITARAYDFYRVGRFGDGLTLLGTLSAADLHVPERASYLGAILAAGGPIDAALVSLCAASTQRGLLPEERRLVESSLRLLAYRRALASSAARPAGPVADQSSDFVSDEDALSPMAQSLHFFREGRWTEAETLLSEIEPAALDAVRLSAFLGGVLELAGHVDEAQPLLQLSPDLSYRSETEKWHQVVQTWWELQAPAAKDPVALRGLLSAYRGLDECESDPNFWQRDASREVALTRTVLAQGLEATAVNARLEALARHMAATPEMQAQQAYTLLLLGQPATARARLEIMDAASRARPLPALYYGLVLTACGDPRQAHGYFALAQRSPLLPEESALIAAARQTL